MLIQEHKTYDNVLGLPIAMVKTRRCEVALHWHYDFEAAFVLEGSVSVSLNGAAARLRAGDAFICSNGDIHSYSDPSEDSMVLLLTFDPLAARKAGTLVLDTGICSSVFRPDALRRDTRFDSLLNRMYEEYTRLNSASAFFLYANILEIQGILHRYYLKQEFQPNSAGRRPHLHAIRDSISYIEENFAREITVAGMARRALMSVSNFSREFKKITGTGFKEYVSLVRLREVTAAMDEGKAGVARIAYDCGFTSVRTFNRVFLTHYGVTPGAYCARLGKR
jgi:AraC-like DNA-binding protein/mannose-6-phosphate isomerase-like protein (cupin superfamily)